jgi:hypothetical protein
VNFFGKKYFNKKSLRFERRLFYAHYNFLKNPSEKLVNQPTDAADYNKHKKYRQVFLPIRYSL